MLDPSPFANIPESRSARWDLLKSAIADWYAPLKKSDINYWRDTALQCPSDVCGFWKLT